MHRILITGRNRDFPRFAEIRLGVRPDGTELIHHYPLGPGEDLCPSCGGYGEFEQHSINPSVKPTTERCDTCCGRGVVAAEAA